MTQQTAPVQAAEGTHRLASRTAAVESVATLHGHTFGDSRAALDDMARAAKLTRRMLNRIVRLPSPTTRDWFMAIQGLDFSLTGHVVLELATIVECISDHDPGWWDEIHLAGTLMEFLNDWGMTPEDAEDTIAWLRVLNRYTIDSLFLSPGARIQQPGLDDLYLTLAVTAAAIRHARRRRDWYTVCCRCRKTSSC